ncbi:MAG TPA: hypothetical protein VKV73_09175 [Chloroflexota bacterium]|nr:hypothetical protein [Chloroflexota bacterium]
MVGQIAGVDHSMVPTSFDTRATALTLQQTDVGGIEIVVARDSGDAAQIDRVRNLLRNEIAQFQQGNYQDPARAHGMPMPGSKELEAGYTRVQVGYTDLPAGGQITYTASDPSLVDAVHAWFDRRKLAP